MTLVLYFVFRRIFGQEKNFVANLITGIVAWRFFSVGTSTCLYSVVGKSSLVTELYIPREIFVLSNAIANFIGSLLEFVILVAALFLLLGHLPYTIVFVPLVHLLYFCLVYGSGLLLSAFIVYIRDLNQIWDVLLNTLFFATPIVYPISVVPKYLLNYYNFNPITQFITIYRDMMVAVTAPTVSNLAIAAGFSILVLVVSSCAFVKLQRRFAKEL